MLPITDTSGELDTTLQNDADINMLVNAVHDTMVDAENSTADMMHIAVSDMLKMLLHWIVYDTLHLLLECFCKTGG